MSFDSAEIFDIHCVMENVLSFISFKSKQVIHTNVNTNIIKSTLSQSTNGQTDTTVTAPDAPQDNFS